VGEIGIRSAALAVGYWGKADATRAAFVGEGPERLYRTGDLGRLLPDGRMEFVGRRDEQVKVRGYRVELGEIEATLRRQPGVAEAVVVARRGAAGEQRLVAYVVAQAGAAPARGALQAGLRETLPEYMVPAAYVMLERLPMTASGKVNRRALPEPETGRTELEATYTAPRTPAEEVVAGIWAEVLRIERVGIHDNFFDLGGHSLLLIQVRSELGRRFDREISVVELFRHSSVAALAKFMSDGAGREGGPSFQDDVHARARRQKEALGIQKRRRTQGGQHD
jgi:hypothetical protein